MGDGAVIGDLRHAPRSDQAQNPDEAFNLPPREQRGPVTLIAGLDGSMGGRGTQFPGNARLPRPRSGKFRAGFASACRYIVAPRRNGTCEFQR